MLAVFGKEEEEDNRKKGVLVGLGVGGWGSRGVGGSGSPELCAPPHHFTASPTLPLKRLQYVSD